MIEYLERGPDLFNKGGGGWPFPQASPELGDGLSARVGSPGDESSLQQGSVPDPFLKVLACPG